MGKRKGLFQGWPVAAAASAMMFTAGNFQYIFGVFVSPLVTYFGWSRAAIAWSVSIRNIVSVVTMPVAGKMSDRFSPRIFILAGVLAISLSYWLSSRITSLWQLYVSFGILSGFGLGLMVVPAVATVSRWFGGKSALANGIVYGGFGLAQVALPPLATWTIMRYGWVVCFTGFAILAFVGGTITWFFVKVPPKVLKLLSDKPSQAEPSGAIKEQNEKVWTLSSAWHTRTLWNLVLIQVVVAICFQTIMIHIVAAAIDIGIVPEAAALILTVSGITNTTGRLLVSSLAGRIGNKVVLVICLAAQGILLFFLLGVKTLPAFCLITGIYGVFYGGIPPLMPTITAEYFGTQSFGSIFGVVSPAYTLGSAIGPLAAGYIFDITGRYYLAFLSAAILMVLVFILSITLSSPSIKKRL